MDQPSFRPLRNQVIEPEETEQEKPTAQAQQQPAFQRRRSGQVEEKQSLFPDWDLLPPRKVVRRKSS